MPAGTSLIRQFQPEDAELSSALVCACLKLDPQMAPAVKEELIRGESPAIMRERANSFYMAVSIVQGGIAGVAGLDMNEIRLLFVDPERQRQGIGTLLLRHLEALVPPALFSDIFVYSAPAAVGFYYSHGYRSGGEYAFTVGGLSVATVFMTKSWGT